MAAVCSQSIALPLVASGRGRVRGFPKTSHACYTHAQPRQKSQAASGWYWTERPVQDEGRAIEVALTWHILRPEKLRKLFAIAWEDILKSMPADECLRLCERRRATWPQNDKPVGTFSVCGGHVQGLCFSGPWALRLPFEGQVHLANRRASRQSWRPEAFER